jgi:uncharacterized protein YidB (DUF937 family)
MSLLQSILGAAAGAMTGQQQSQSNPLLQVALGLLSNGNAQGGIGGLGGLQGLMGLFQNKGMGDVIGSWVGTGQNSAISGDQLMQVLGSGQIGQIASQLGLSQGDAASQLAQVLPGLIDHLTPQGQAPAQGFGGAEDIMKMIGGLMQQR